MNMLLFRSVLGISLFIMVACKKENRITSDKTTTIQVINGIIKEDVQLKMDGELNESGANASSTQENAIAFGTGTFYYSQGQTTGIEILRKFSTKSLYNNTYDFKSGGIYTLLLTGVSPNVESVLMDDSELPKIDLSIPPGETDSIINIRFINLCPDAQSLSIRLTGSTTNEVSELAYQQYTKFKAYPAKIAAYLGTSGYSVFSIEVVENSKVLKTFSMNVNTQNRFKNVALVINGMKTPAAAQPALTVSAVNYFH